MSREESPEDRKLLAVKSWFARSGSSTTTPQNGSVLDEVSLGTSTSKEGVVQSETGSTSLRSQLSMRRSRVSGETEKEVGAVNPVMTIKNITPLTPLTPLKWKSNSREQEGEEKVMERSRLGSAVAVSTIYEECPEGKSVAENGKEGAAVADANDATSPVDELSTSIQAGMTDEDVRLESLEGLDRKPSSGDDVMTMTIDFLRARLLSERSAAKTAKLRIQQLAEKVSELEEKLGLAIEDRKKAEASAEEAFMKLKLAESSNQGTNRTSGEVPDQSISTSTKGLLLSKSSAGQEDTKYLQLNGSSDKDLSRTNSYGSSVEDRDIGTKKLLSETVSKTEERTAEQGRLGVRSAPQNLSESSQELPQKQESRAVIESRLQNMWNKISEDMIALADERRDVREELMSWMDQVPAVLHNIIPKKSVSPMHDVDLRLESDRIGLQGVARPMVESQPERSSETVQVKGQLQAEPKKAPLLNEQFAAQGRNYHESPQKVEHFKGDGLYASSPPITPTGHRELQNADNKHGPNGVIDNSLFLGSHLARLAKSKSTLDFSARSNGIPEDGYRSSTANVRDDKDRRSNGRHQQAQTRDSEIKKSYSSSQPENKHAHRRQHQRSHSDNYDWPALEDYALLNQQPEPCPDLGRRQSYSGYPASMAADPRLTSFEKPLGSNDDLRYGVERMNGADGQRRNTVLASKANNAPGKLNSNETSINGYSDEEPTLSLGYGPAYDAPPREDSPVHQSPKAGIDKNISDVLRALQLAKATIQNGGASRLRRRDT